jgi:hypothetical protein
MFVFHVIFEKLLTIKTAVEVEEARRQNAAKLRKKKKRMLLRIVTMETVNDFANDRISSERRS